MNRNDCDIARDLMPLSVDGVCSEGSQRFIDAHVAECKPCHDYFDGMKTGMLNIKMEPTQEAKSLKKSLRHVAKRFKALWLTLISLACAFALLLTASGYQQTVWHKTEWAPLDMYSVSLYSNDALVSLGLSCNFYEQVYNGFQQDRYYFALVGDDEEHVILTYLVSWFPNQHKKIADTLSKVSTATATPTLIPFQGKDNTTERANAQLVTPEWNSDYHFTTVMESHQLCVDNGQLYILDGWDSVETTTGRSMLVAQLGTPVYEVRVSDGKETRTIYAAWRGDEITNVSADKFDKNGLPMSGVISPSDLEKYADFIVK